jgi:hypothetical protein
LNSARIGEGAKPKKFKKISSKIVEVWKELKKMKKMSISRVWVVNDSNNNDNNNNNDEKYQQQQQQKCCMRNGQTLHQVKQSNITSGQTVKHYKWSNGQTLHQLKH